MARWEDMARQEVRTRQEGRTRQEDLTRQDLQVRWETYGQVGYEAERARRRPREAG